MAHAGNVGTALVNEEASSPRAWIRPGAWIRGAFRSRADTAAAPSPATELGASAKLTAALARLGNRVRRRRNHVSNNVTDISADLAFLEREIDYGPFLKPGMLQEILGRVTSTFRRGPYIVCGHAAMAAWGYQDIPPRDIHLICPANPQTALLRSSAAYRGSDTQGELEIECSDGSRFNVNILWLEPYDDRYQSTRLPVPTLRKPSRFALFRRNRADNGTISCNSACFLTLHGLLDRLAQSFIDVRRIQKVETQLRISARKVITHQILWILRQLAAQLAAERRNSNITSPARLTSEVVPHVADANFWATFIHENPEGAQLFFAAGMSADIAGDRNAIQAFSSPNFGGEEAESEGIQEIQEEQEDQGGPSTRVTHQLPRSSRYSLPILPSTDDAARERVRESMEDLLSNYAVLGSIYDESDM